MSVQSFFHLTKGGTRKPPSHVAPFSPRNGLLPPSGQEKISAPLSEEERFASFAGALHEVECAGKEILLRLTVLSFHRRPRHAPQVIALYATPAGPCVSALPLGAPGSSPA
jgi:hypothetical protein